MKFSEQWLRTWVNPSISTTELADQLSMLGLEVDNLLPVAVDCQQIKIGFVNACEPHPDAKKLSVCQVDIGAEDLLTIVCGATNVCQGIKIAVAVIGANIAGMDIKPTTLRGVESFGMICSAKELGLAEESNGIMVLPEAAPLGTSLQDYLELDDTSIDIDLTPNRGDCFSIQGVAREVACRNKLTLTPPEISPITNTITTEHDVNIHDFVACGCYVGRVIKNINPDAVTPIWMQERLRRSHLRCIHPVVDVTNYVMLELGQPMHAFDLAQIDKGIVVRYAKENEKLQILNDETITLDSETLVIADKIKPLALAGIMGGLHSGVTSATTDIFLESAFFNPVMICQKARQYGLQTDSSQRFERGVDSELQVKAMQRATTLLLDIVGGEAGPILEKSDSKTLPQTQTIMLRRDRIHALLGTTIDDSFIVEVLTRLNFNIEANADGWQVQAPSFRFDMSIEEDVIEEIVRHYGYNNLPTHIPKFSGYLNAVSESTMPLSRVRHLLADLGYREAICYSFVDSEIQQLLAPEIKPLALANPISQDLSQMRTTLWAGLLRALQANQKRQQASVRLFETGLRFVPQDNELRQERMIAGVASGWCLPPQWSVDNKKIDFYDIKGDLTALFTLLDKQDDVNFVAAEHPALHPGQSCKIIVNDETCGYLGALHPRLVSELNLQGPVYLFELTSNVLTKIPLPAYEAFSKYPMITRDLAFWVAKGTSFAAIRADIEQNAGELLKKLEIFDVYYEKELESANKSMALRLTFQHSKRTLVDDEIQAVVTAVVSSLQKNFSAILRD